jgi:hypothetical protein
MASTVNGQSCRYNTFDIEGVSVSCDSEVSSTYKHI